MLDGWPWLTLVGLGMYHGLNPAMGWLFAVALGLHRGSPSVVLTSLIPIAAGHALAVGVTAAAMLAAGVLLSADVVRSLAGGALVGWALYHQIYGTRHRVRVGMQTGLVGLGLWSFLMAGTHGAGLMIMPVLLPLCSSGPDGRMGDWSAAMTAVVGLHTASMLIVTAVVAIAVYHWLGVGVLRRGWLNFDRVWSAALAATGALLLAGL
jgi:hypothetical protein